MNESPKQIQSVPWVVANKQLVNLLRKNSKHDAENMKTEQNIKVQN